MPWNFDHAVKLFNDPPTQFFTSLAGDPETFSAHVSELTSIDLFPGVSLNALKSLGV